LGRLEESGGGGKITKTRQGLLSPDEKQKSGDGASTEESGTSERKETKSQKSIYERKKNSLCAYNKRTKNMLRNGLRGENVGGMPHKLLNVTSKYEEFR